MAGKALLINTRFTAVSVLGITDLDDAVTAMLLMSRFEFPDIDQVAVQEVLEYTNPDKVSRFFTFTFATDDDVVLMVTNGASPAITFTSINVELFRVVKLVLSVMVRIIVE